MALQAKILATDVICTEEGRYLGWPTVCRRTNGELLVAFSGDRDEHVCPHGVTQIIRSADGGRTWSAPRTITDTPLDDRDAGIIETDQGTLLVSWFTSVAYVEKDAMVRAWYGDERVDSWSQEAAKVTPAVRERWLGSWIRRSTDDGATWGEPIRAVGSAPHGPIQIADGRLLQVGKVLGSRNGSVVVEASRDDGQSWQQIGEVPVAEALRVVGGRRSTIAEPHVVQAADGSLLAMIRYQPPDEAAHIMLQSRSRDGGKTWSMSRSSGIWGYPPHLLRLANGWLLCSHGYRRAPYAERACVSRDHGKTWERPELDICRGINADLGYPATTELPDRTLITVYYQCLNEGEPTVLMATRWRLIEG